MATETNREMFLRGHAAGKRETEAALYAEIRRLPNPWKADPFCQRIHCEWCGAFVDMPVSHETDDTVRFAVVPHPDSTCLWPRAHAEATPTAHEDGR